MKATVSWFLPILFDYNTFFKKIHKMQKQNQEAPKCGETVWHK